MKPKLWLLALTMSSLPWLAMAAERCQTVRYATNPQYPPYDWEQNGRYVGASIELLQRVMPPGIRIKAVMVPWKRAQLLAEHGKIDLLVSLRITPEREKYLLFTTLGLFRIRLWCSCSRTKPCRA